ncbi:MAG: polysaccharide pyruvyl transferase family protein [Cyanobacteria bacterium J06635_15]
MKILITNAVALNAGDAAILKGIIKILQRVFGNDVDITVYDKQKIVKKYYPETDFRTLLFFENPDFLGFNRPARLIRWVNRKRLDIAIKLWAGKLSTIAKLLLNRAEQDTIKDYDNADLIVSTGGTYLTENYPLGPRILDYELSLNLKRNLIFFTQSLGPFKQPKNREALTSIFERAALIFLRDEQSLHHLKDLSIKNPNVYVTSDAAFALADPQKLEAAIGDVKHLSHPKVAISVRDWQYFKTVDATVGKGRYLTSIGELTTHLVREYSANVTFISTCQGIPEYHLDDSDTALEIFSQLSDDVKESVVVNTKFHSPENLSKLVQAFDFVIATRLHMAILSLGSGVPVFPIAYEFKTQELFGRLNQQHWVIDIEEIESEKLIAKVDNFMQAIPTFRRELFSGVLQEYNEVFRSAELLKNI